MLAERPAPFALPYVFPEDCDLTGRRVLIVGLGLFGGGVAVARFMAGLGARITITDLRDPVTLAEPLAEIADLTCTTVLGEHRDSDFRNADFVVVGPGVPPGMPLLSVALAAGAKLISEVGLTLTRLTTNRLALVTGSKGKSTTTALLHHMASRTGRSWLGGNIGRPLLGVCDQVKQDDVVAFEVSSFQLEQLRGAPFSAKVAVVTNLFPVHLDRHGDFESYVTVKREVVATASSAVLLDDPIVQALGQGVQGQVRLFGESEDASLRLVGHDLFDLTGSRQIEKIESSEIQIMGRHNRLNISAALLAADCLGIPEVEAVEAAKEFPGLPHRLEIVADREGVRWINDSIATTIRSVCAALDVFRERSPGRVVVIMGGQDSGSPLDPLADSLRDSAKVLLAMGDVGPRLRSDLGELLPDLEVQVVDDLEAATGLARILGEPGDVILMSPGFPSFDQFRNFADRGEAFRRRAICKEAR